MEAMEPHSHVIAFLSEFRIQFILFMYYFARCLAWPATKNLIIDKLCFPDQPPGVDIVCNDSQKRIESTDIGTIQAILQECVPCLLVILAGSWRDITGLSRPLMVVSHIGDLLSTATVLVSSAVWSVSPWTTGITESFLSGLFGGSVLITMAGICYVTDRTPVEKRTYRIALVNAAMLFSGVMAGAASGYLLEKLDYIYYYILVFGLYIASLLLTLFIVTEERNDVTASFQFISAFSKLKVVFQHKPNRKVAWLVIAASSIAVAALVAESTVMFPFLQQVCSFNVKEIGLFGTYKTSITIAGTILITPLLQIIFKGSDFYIIIISTLLSVVYLIGVGYFYVSQTLLYIFSSLDLLRFTQLSALRSLLTKCVENNELGSFFSACSIGESLLKLLFLPTYDLFFNFTIKYDPGNFLMISEFSLGAVIILVQISKWIFVEAPYDASSEAPIISREDDSDDNIQS